MSACDVMAPVSCRKRASPTTRNPASARVEPAGQQQHRLLRAPNRAPPSRPARCPKPWMRLGRHAPSIATLASLRPAPVPPTAITTRRHPRRARVASARTKITLAPCAATPRAIASADASAARHRRRRARAARARARAKCRQPAAPRRRPRATFRPRAAMGDPARHPHRRRARHRPAVAAACTSRRSPSYGVRRQHRIRFARHRGARIDPSGRGIEQHRRIRPGIRDLLGTHRPPIDERDRRGGRRPARSTSSASTRPSASASASSRGATGCASAATRASTCAIGVRLEMRCAAIRTVCGRARASVKQRRRNIAKGYGPMAQRP